MSIKMYTIGYEKRTIEDYIDELQRVNINILIDVRQTAWSHKKGFSKSQFSILLSEAKIQYIHIPKAGNPKSIRRASKSVESCLMQYRAYLNKTEAGMEELKGVMNQAKMDGHNVCLTCFEREPSQCHRSIIIDFIVGSDKSLKVHHL